jgi:hypothetical protein
MDNSEKINFTDRERELLVAIRGTLEKNNSLNQLKCMIRSKVLNIVRGGHRDIISGEPKQSSSQEKGECFRLVNSLILEYLKWFGYQYTAENFQTEAVLEEARVAGRNELEEQLTVHPADEDLPVLLQLLIQKMRL